MKVLRESNNKKFHCSTVFAIPRLHSHTGQSEHNASQKTVLIIHSAKGEGTALYRCKVRKGKMERKFSPTVMN